ncbi:type II toxin-antitoxin system RelE/ParE family toxin [Kushneria aurantia]|uniref:Type II toxin-antitoxin system RelE/ParE family toxin n=1 Tax=Kushneria aurantia TaxID=504092 RepID=A0ABV6G4F3_9GAMM|nr:type II toxin-antitoxin system RelE/ParE family toxin [Kushneria aurantia]
MRIEWSDEAQLDLVDIQSWIEQSNPRAAETLRAAIASGVGRLSQAPHAFPQGRVVGTREYVVHPNYILIYSIDATVVTVLRLLHARRQYP